MPVQALLPTWLQVPVPAPVQARVLAPQLMVQLQQSRPLPPQQQREQ